MIEVDNITVSFGSAEALRGLTLTLAPGQRLGLVGESGSGKTMLGLSMMGMLPETAKLSGKIRIAGRNMADAPDHEWRDLRARGVAMIFQEPATALNPLRRVGKTLMEPLRLHLGMSRNEAYDRALELLHETGIVDPLAKIRQYPHELSGGQRQRVLIALALSCNPKVLIADEPTSALDAHVGLRITELLVRLSHERGMALMLISHDIAAVARTSELLAVMYGGEIVELGPVADILKAPRHPYTKGLLSARPPITAGRLRQRLPVIPGAVPAMKDLPIGCRFSGRCSVEIERCATERTGLDHVSDGHIVACHRLGYLP